MPLPKAAQGQGQGQRWQHCMALTLVLVQVLQSPQRLALLGLVLGLGLTPLTGEVQLPSMLLPLSLLCEPDDGGGCLEYIQHQHRGRGRGRGRQKEKQRQRVLAGLESWA